MGLSILGGGSGGAGVLKVADDAARLALTPTDGTVVYQLDTDELWTYDTPSTTWYLLAVIGWTVFYGQTNSISLSQIADPGSPRPAEAVTLVADLNLSVAAADAGKIKIANDIQADGLRSQITISDIYALFSATAPLAYNNTTGVFSIPAADGLTDGYLTSIDWTRLDTAYNHISDATDAHDASAISVVATGNLASTDVQNALVELQGDIDNHLSDTTDAHDASAISVVPVGALAATDVQAALAELDSDLTGHLTDATDAHDASAISNVPTGNLAATDVQGALNELQSDIDGRPNVTLAAIGSTPNANGATLSTQALNLEPANTSFGGVMTAAAQDIGGVKSFASGAKVGATGALAASSIFQVVSTSAGALPAPSMTTVNRSSIASPAVGLLVFDSDLGRYMMYDGTTWQPITGANIVTTTAVTDGGTLTPTAYYKQTAKLTAVAVSTISVANGSIDGQELKIVGGSDTNTVTLTPSANLNINGSMTLGLEDIISLVWIAGTSKWCEVSRSE